MLFVSEICVDYGSVKMFQICLDFCIVYGVGVCVIIRGVLCVVVCRLFFRSGCCDVVGVGVSYVMRVVRGVPLWVLCVFRPVYVV